MIEAEHTIAIDASIDSVWDYVRDIRKWANLFPGCRECNVIDDDNSHWVIKVGAGGLVRTVNVLVHIEQWAGPEQVLFSYKLDAEPVVGSGSYTARRISDEETEIALQVRVEGSGSMAPMWEAVSRPLLPQLAKTFSARLKTEIETATSETVTGETSPQSAIRPTLFARVMAWLKSRFRGGTRAD